MTTWGTKCGQRPTQESHDTSMARITNPVVYLMVAAAVLVELVGALLGDVWSWFAVPATLLCVFLIPGYLLALNLGIRPRRPAEMLVYSVGLSIATMYALGLTLNAALPRVGLSEPLGATNVAWAISAVILALLLLAWRRGRELAIVVPLARVTPGATAMAAFAVVTVGLSVMGAVALNNGAETAIPLVAMAAMAVYVSVLLGMKRRAPQGLYAFALYCLCLGLLLAVSLRGWEISGHDVLTEFYVFKLTLAHHLWNVANFQDAYSACLSITILPTMVSSLLPIPPEYVYRVVFQLVIALMPVALFVFAGNFLKRQFAFLAVLFFMVQSPFLRDFPYLVRQEVAFFFYALILLVLFSTALPRLAKNMLFSIFGLAMVLSHYSTTYMAVTVLALWVVLDWLSHRRSPAQLKAAFARLFAGALPAFDRVLPEPADLRQELIPATISSPSVTPLRPAEGGSAEERASEASPLLPSRRPASASASAVPNPLLVVGLILAAFIWIGPVTHTSGNLVSTVSAALSSQTLLSAGTGTSESNAELIRRFSTSTPADPTAPGGTYPSADYAGYDLDRTVDVLLPSRFGPAVTSASSGLAWLLQNLMKLLIALGVCWMLFEVHRRRYLGRDLATLAAVNLALLAVATTVPVVRLNYDLLRAYQQLLVVLCIPAVLGCLVLFSRFGRRIRYWFVGGAFVLYFLVVSPMIPQIIGGSTAHLQFNNFGLYYNLYLTHESESASIAWLSAHGDRNVPVFADWFATKRIVALSDRPIWVVDNLLPQNITRDSYVFIDYTNRTTGAAYVFYDGHELDYSFPSDFVHSTKDVVYSNGSSEILR